ncbi:MAG TPA: hypothetical protein VJU16_05660, partial [Planctomycetota bacterium]|nr:hypothetical protein [Planctomycetota bacterium]
ELWVQVETRNTPEWTGIQLKWPSAKHLRVAPQDLSSWILRALGNVELLIGDPDFDRAFWIETSDEIWARRLLKEDLRRRILGLQDLGPGGNRICLDVNRVGISARVFRRLSNDEEALVSIVETAAEVLRHLRPTPAPGQVAVGPLKLTDTGACPICGAKADARHACPGCGTPHHVECWKYAGGCGMFACAGRSRRKKK